MGSNSSKTVGGGTEHLQATLTEHSDSINCMTVAEDHSVLVAGSEDSTASMWTTNEGGGADCLGTLKGHEGYVTSVDVFDTFVITGSSDCTVRKWDVFNCECEYIYKGHAEAVMRVICTGDYIISSSKDKTAKIWTFDTEELGSEESPRACIRTLKGHLKTVHPLIFIRQGEGGSQEDLVITGSADNTAKLWATDTGSCLITYRDHRGAIMTMTTDKEARVLFTGSVDTTIRSFEIRTGRPLKVFEGHSKPVMCLSVVNKLMYSGDTGGTAKGWAWQFGDCTCDYSGHKHSVTCLCFYNGVLYTGCGDGLCRAFNAKTGVLLQTYVSEDERAVVNCMSVCDRKLFTGSRDSKLRVWDISNMKC